jgi:hypothetical protein
VAGKASLVGVGGDMSNMLVGLVPIRKSGFLMTAVSVGKFTSSVVPTKVKSRHVWSSMGIYRYGFFVAAGVRFMYEVTEVLDGAVH